MSEIGEDTVVIAREVLEELHGRASRNATLGHAIAEAARDRGQTWMAEVVGVVAGEAHQAQETLERILLAWSWRRGA